jgi:hypothetical protein
MKASRRPPLSAVFSPRVRWPLTWTLSAGFFSSTAVKELYSSARQSVRVVKFLRSAGVHQSSRLPLASNLRPSSSKPWVSSWQMTSPLWP